MTEQELAKYLEEVENYQNVRILPDGIIGITKLIFSWGLCVDMNKHSYEKRFCYTKKEEAIAACNAMNSVDDEPLPGYIAKR